MRGCAVSAAQRSRFRLPARYEEQWGKDFWEYAERALRPGVTILDVGAGRRPTILPDRRPEGTHYVGTDISGEELAEAEPGSYDETVVADAHNEVPGLVGRFDLIVAWQVLEHFEDLPSAAAQFHRYARPGGWFVAMLSGKNAAFSIANRILPDAVGARVVGFLMRRPVETVFPAHYDHADERGLHEAFSAWDELHVIPFWRGAGYFARLPGVRGLYLRYEDWAQSRSRGNLATHYTVAARKSPSS
jgi:SAM-dependent methyltransferase